MMHRYHRKPGSTFAASECIAWEISADKITFEKGKKKSVFKAGDYTVMYAEHNDDLYQISFMTKEEFHKIFKDESNE